MLKNAVWNDPIGWAKKVVGTKKRYYLFVYIHVLAAVVAGISTLWGAMDVGMLIVFIVVGTMFPLAYLRALHAFLNEGKK